MQQELSLHDKIMIAYNNYLRESQTFEQKGVKAAAARARRALQELNKLTTQRRKEIQEQKFEL
jgi:N-glycosylase/DNA lyase